MKRFVLPKKIRIGGLDYTVEFPCNFDTNDYMGKTYFYNTTIKVANTSLGYPIKNGIIVETLVHEVLHAIDIVYVGQVFEEEDIERLSKAIVMLFKYNDFSLLDDNIPDVIHIMNEDIEVVTDYEFEDKDACYQINPMYSVMLLNTNDQNIQRLKHGILEMCIKRIRNVLYIDPEGDENFSRLRAWTTGIFQVLRDNSKLEQLIKEWA